MPILNIFLAVLGIIAVAYVIGSVFVSLMYLTLIAGIGFVAIGVAMVGYGIFAGIRRIFSRRT